jgi:AraC-like DNA-binding protein
MKSITKVLLFRTLLCVFFSFFSTNLQAQLRIEVELTVPLMDPSKPIFIALNYNNWISGDKDFILKPLDNKRYYIVLENPPKYFEYKFTQGTWLFTEGTPNGQTLPNRIFNANNNVGNSIKTAILGWEKRIYYNIYLKTIPENTPKDSKIFMCGNFNNWESDNPNYELKKDQNGFYYLKLITDLPKIEYIFTRGNWKTVESKSNGKARTNRVFFRSNRENEDLSISIDGWEDLLGTLQVYSIFDLLILFSIFQGILLMVSIPIVQRNNIEANRWLILSMAISSLALLFYFLGDFKSFVNNIPRVVLLSDFIYFLYGPVFYFYIIKTLFNVKGMPSRWYLHFIPAFIQLFVYLPFLLKNDKVFLLDLMNQNTTVNYVLAITSLMGLLWNVFYWNLSRKAISASKKEIHANLSYEQNTSYLNTVLIIQFVCICFWAFVAITFVLSKLLDYDNFEIIEGGIDYAWLIFSFIPYFVGYFAIHQPETFKANPQSIALFEDVLEETIVAKLKQTDATQENLEPMANILEKYIVDNQPYKKPKISLNELAMLLKWQPHLLSKIINEYHNQNFFDYINTFRVEEFKEMVKDPKNQHLTFLGLAFEVGFNSKTAFNRAFKKSTNQTPREYLDGIKNE